MRRVPTIPLNNGVPIPQLGLGTGGLDDVSVQPVLHDALDLGYRLIDTAARYGNETGIGEALRRREVAREELFLVSKLRGADHGYDAALRAFDASLVRLGVEDLDLYLIHWHLPRLDAYVDVWHALERLYEEGRVRAIGVSNFLPEHLDRLEAEAEVVPAVNQIELHPWLPQDEQRADNARRGILTQGWSPLGAGGLREPVPARIAGRHGVTSAQVVIRWHLQLGVVVFPKASSRQRLAQNLEVFELDLVTEELEEIAGGSRTERGSAASTRPRSRSSDTAGGRSSGPNRIVSREPAFWACLTAGDHQVFRRGNPIHRRMLPWRDGAPHPPGRSGSASSRPTPGRRQRVASSSR